MKCPGFSLTGVQSRFVDPSLPLEIQFLQPGLTTPFIESLLNTPGRYS
jgi:hypothetical protein